MKSAKLLKLLYVQVLIGLVLGIAVGHWWPEFGAALKPLGDGFVKLVKMMIAPIVFCTIVSGITSLNDSKQIGKTLLKSMGLFYALTILALLTGLAAVFLLQPGAESHRPEAPRSAVAKEPPSPRALPPLPIPSSALPHREVSRFLSLSFASSPSPLTPPGALSAPFQLFRALGFLCARPSRPSPSLPRRPTAQSSSLASSAPLSLHLPPPPPPRNLARYTFNLSHSALPPRGSPLSTSSTTRSSPPSS